uniref:Protein kinase domain-containing protein n=1 Tax=Pseudo-nitzschia australis TaxID=44445 RepID=A0A7S4AAT0_9STRA|mmetsp:Transcript_1231/g.2798  ORF Transcript_1231/g.2798 Transcript_1231/m.2798 type:complete len:741 (-) Transcript_1231:227-2449(-)
MVKTISDRIEEGCDSDQDRDRDERYSEGWNHSTLSRRRKAGSAAFEQVEHMSKNSKLDRFDEVLSVPWSVIVKKKLLGEGGFSFVYKVQVLMDKDDRKQATTPLNTKKYYALKHIRPEMMERSEDFRTAATDLALEGDILSRLRHENIIKLHGIYAGDPKTAYVDFTHGYFILLDVLESTLTCRLKKMRKLVKKKQRGAIPNVLELIQSIAMGIAKGLKYLHGNNVILRDLKPDNVGFDANGTPIIFDLGFARELHTVQESEVAGSLRYMAPEMNRREGVTFASDVYSFGVLLYEICTLEKPFKQYDSRPEFVQDVFIHNYRPDLTTIASKAIRDLIANCWDTNPSKRPTMKTVGTVLCVETSLYERQLTFGRGEMVSTLRRNDSMNSCLSSSKFGSNSSFCSLMRRGLRKRNSSLTSIPTCSSNSSLENMHSFASRISTIRRMSSNNADWNSNPPADKRNPVNDKTNNTFGRVLRRRNSMTSSLLDRRRGSMSSLVSVESIKELGSTEIVLNDTEDLSPSSLTEHAQSNHPPKHSLIRPSRCFASNDSISPAVSFSGESNSTSCSADTLASNFTLGEFRPLVRGQSRRNSLFSSFSSKKECFKMDCCRRSNSDDGDNAGDCIEDMFSPTEEENGLPSNPIGTLKLNPPDISTLNLPLKSTDRGDSKATALERPVSCSQQHVPSTASTHVPVLLNPSDSGLMTIPTTRSNFPPHLNLSPQSIHAGVTTMQNLPVQHANFN